MFGQYGIYTVFELKFWYRSITSLSLTSVLMQTTRPESTMKHTFRDNDILDREQTHRKLTSYTAVELYYS